MNHDLRYRRRKPDNTGPRGSGRTTRILRLCIGCALTGDNVIFMTAGALKFPWDLCKKIKQPKKIMESMRQLHYGNKGGWIMFANNLRRELMIGTDRKVVLDHTFEWKEGR